MRVTMILLAGWLALTISVRAQGPGPFVELEEQVRSQQGGWNGSKRPLSILFDKERRRLGDRFESELHKYVAGDPEKHYWISLFLEEPSYLHGNKPLLHLSLRLMEQGISLTWHGNDEESAGHRLAFHVLAAVLSHKLALTEQAIRYKNEAEQALAEKSDLRAYFPAMSQEDSKLYDAIKASSKSVRSSLPADQSSDRPHARLSAGVLNGRAKKLPTPAYPAALREVSGQVIVSIVIDEAGKVIWAKAVSGPPQLFQTAEQAAWKAEFALTKLEGKPERVSGVLIYRFVNR
ncbi:MAG TPA: energy transducer TonB [Pyrinomonadaceae bacterium]